MLDGAGQVLRTTAGAVRCNARVVGLRRFPLGEAYTSIAQCIDSLMRRSDLPGCPLAVDCTGVGVSVLEQIDAVVPVRSRVYPVVITGGSHVTRHERYLHIPKTQLAGGMRAALESGDLKIAQALEHAELLKKELLSFEVRITNKAHEVFEAKPGDYDDMVISVALSLFVSTWLDSQMTFIAGPASRVGPIENTSAAMWALTQGGRITFPDRRTGAGQDRSGWQPVGTFPLAPRSGSGIFGDPNG
jgi:hypothetical protein